MCPGICKDRLADAFERFGRVPIERRKLVVPPDHSAVRAAEDPFWSAGGLLHDGRGRVLLIRHVLGAGRGGAAGTAPGGPAGGGGPGPATAPSTSCGRSRR